MPFPWLFKTPLLSTISATVVSFCDCPEPLYELEFCKKLYTSTLKKNRINVEHKIYFALQEAIYQVSSSGMLELKFRFSLSMVFVHVVEVTMLFWVFCATISSWADPVLLNSACSRYATVIHALKTWGQHAELWDPRAKPEIILIGKFVNCKIFSWFSGLIRLTYIEKEAWKLDVHWKGRNLVFYLTLSFLYGGQKLFHQAVFSKKNEYVSAGEIPRYINIKLYLRSVFNSNSK